MINLTISLIHSAANANLVREKINGIDDSTLVIWDVDGVLLIGRDRIFHSENIHSGLNDEYVSYIQNKYGLTPEQRDRFTSQLLIQRPIELVDKALAIIIDDLKTRQIKTIALTQFAVGPFGDIKSIADWRLQELNDLGIKFDPLINGLEKIELDRLSKFYDHHPLYKHGVIFCNRHTKGDVLGAFLDAIKWQPKNIIFIDDKVESLESVQAELKQRHINFVGVHYTAALDIPYDVDDRIVKLQYEHVMQNGIWLNDQVAVEKYK